MGLRRRGVHRRTVRSKVDATPPWEEATPPPPPATTGPYDVADVPDDGIERADFGCLQLPVLPEVGIKFALDSGSPQTVQTVALVQEGVGGAEFVVCSAPRTSGIWDDIRAQLLDSIKESGGAGQEVSGAFGTEVIGHVGMQGNQMPIRYVGIDGPRWFLRVLFTGAPVLSPEKPTLVEEAVRKAVVVRGDQPLPVREVLPFKTPEGFDFTDAEVQA